MPQAAAAPQQVTREQAQQLAAAVLLRRKEAQDSTLKFAQYTMRDYAHGPHHAIIGDALDDVERGKIKRLMIFAPPRHMKSELASKRFVARYIGKHPTHQVINACHTQELADDFGHDVRSILKSEEFAHVFDGKVELAADSQAQSKWRTNQGGIYVTVGVGGPLTGRGAHLAIIDDPIKGDKDAQSEGKREDLWKWYTKVLMTRQMPDAAIILICTRWHEDDLAGRLLKAMKEGGDQWHVISLPAITQNAQGQDVALWPDPLWWPLQKLYALRKMLQARGGTRDWLCLYQQQPTADAGTHFHRQFYDPNRYTVRPAVLTIYMTGDFAVTPNKGDFTELAVWGVSDTHDVYVLDWWYGKTSSDVWVDMMLAKFAQWNPLYFVGEQGVIRRAVEPFLMLRMREPGRTPCSLEWLPGARGDGDKTAKLINATSFHGMSSMGRIHFPHLEWAERVIDQLVKFDVGSAEPDDAVDACGLIGRFLMHVWGAQQPPPPEKNQLALAWSARPTIAEMLQPTKKSAGWDD